MRDADIFGDEKKMKGDADIFVDVTPESPKTMAAKPPEKGFSYLDAMKQGGLALAQGLIKGGALGVAQAGVGEAMRHIDEGTDYVAQEAGGLVTDAASGTLSPEGAAKAGVAANIAIRALPMIASGGLAKQAAGTFQNIGRGLMQSALKPDYASLRTGKAGKAIDTLLKEGVSVSEGGLVKVQQNIHALKDEVNGLIASSPENIRVGDVGKGLMTAYNKLIQNANPQAGLESVRKAWSEFKSHPLIAGRDEIPVQLAQTLKKGTNKDLGDAAYGMGLKPAGERDAKKGLVLGLKEAIEEKIPGVQQLNAKQSELLNAAKLLERRVLMDPNKNLLGLAPLGINPLSWLLFMADRAPGLKSLAARGLYSGAEQIPATAARTGVGYLMMPPEDQRGALYDFFP
jgi:hypothetical protein